MIKALPVVSSKRRWTLAEVRWMIDHNPDYTPRYELVDGELLVTSTPTFAHQSVLGELMVELGNYLELEAIGECAGSSSGCRQPRRRDSWSISGDLQ